MLAFLVGSPVRIKNDCGGIYKGTSRDSHLGEIPVF